MEIPHQVGRQAGRLLNSSYPLASFEKTEKKNFFF